MFISYTKNLPLMNLVGCIVAECLQIRGTFCRNPQKNSMVCSHFPCILGTRVKNDDTSIFSFLSIFWYCIEKSTELQELRAFFFFMSINAYSGYLCRVFPDGVTDG